MPFTAINSLEAAFDTGDREATAAITKRRFFKLDTTNSFKIAAISADTDTGVGILSADAEAGATVTAAFSGILYVEAGAAITKNELLKVDSVGRVQPISGSPPTQQNVVGVALASCTASGEYIPILRAPGVAWGGTLAVAAIEAFTGDDTLTAAESGKLCTNLGAAATVTLTLPSAAAAKTTFYFVNNNSTYALRIKSNTNDAFHFNGAKQSDNKYIELPRYGDALLIAADANGDWIVIDHTGRLTVETAGLTPDPQYVPNVVVKTQADSPVTVGNWVSGTWFTNLGASGACTFNLPAAPTVGTRYVFFAQAAQNLVIDPGASDGVYVNGALQADGEDIIFDAVGEWLEVVADTAGNWMARYSGTMTP